MCFTFIQVFQAFNALYPELCVFKLNFMSRKWMKTRLFPGFDTDIDESEIKLLAAKVSDFNRSLTRQCPINLLTPVSDHWP